MKIVIPGGSGQVGTVLARHFSAAGHEVAVLSRAPKPAPWKAVPWDAHSLGPWTSELEGADAVINLVGRSVNCRYTPANRREIIDSRVKSARLIANAIATCAVPPRVWLQASTATIYAHRFDAPNDELTGVLGTEPDAPDTWKFSFDVATRWEQALEAARVPQTRKVAMRAAITLNPDPGSAFAVLLGLVRRRLGGRAGDGRQFVSWVHDHDFAAAVEFLVRRDDLSGAVNIAAPNPLPNADFMRGLRGLGRSVRPTRFAVDDRGGRVGDAHGIGTGAEEPPGGAAPAARRRVRLPVPGVVRRGPRPVRPLARRALTHFPSSAGFSSSLGFAVPSALLTVSSSRSIANGLRM